MTVQVPAGLRTETPRSRTSLTASILDSRLNLRLCMIHLRLYETPKLGAHQIGSSSNRVQLTIERSKEGLNTKATYVTRKNPRSARKNKYPILDIVFVA
jgi:hypothetical protein